MLRLPLVVNVQNPSTTSLLAHTVHTFSAPTPKYTLFKVLTYTMNFHQAILALLPLLLAPQVEAQSS